jgi:hypothetical protein
MGQQEVIAYGFYVQKRTLEVRTSARRIIKPRQRDVPPLVLQHGRSVDQQFCSVCFVHAAKLAQFNPGPVLPVAQNRYRCRRPREQAQKVRKQAESIGSIYGIAGEQEHIGREVVHRLGNPLLMGADPLQMQVGELHQTQRALRSGRSTQHVAGDADATRLDPAGVRTDADRSSGGSSEKVASAQHNRRCA